MKSKRIANIKKTFSADSDNIHQDVTDFVSQCLSQLGISKKLGARTVLLSEETTVQFLRCAPEGSTLRVQVKRFLGDTSVILSMPGVEFDPFGVDEEDSEDAIRAVLLQSAGENYKYRNSNGVNRVRLQTGQSEHAMLYYTIGSLVLGLGRCNPIIFYRKNKEGMLTSFVLSSSSAALPTNLRICKDEMGISPKVCNFSIPLGATVNMDGNCLYYSIFGLFLARAYAVNVPASSMLSFAITIALLSLATPGVAGAGIIMLAVTLKSIHVPVEAIGLIMGISSLLGMIQTMSNTTGDVATALIVAKSEKLLDEEIYNN